MTEGEGNNWFSGILVYWEYDLPLNHLLTNQYTISKIFLEKLEDTVIFEYLMTCHGYTKRQIVMSEETIKEVNKVLYPFIKKILYDSNLNTDLKQNAEDILQETWRKTWEKYPDKRKDINQFRALLFVVAKNEALKSKQKKSKLLSISGKSLETMQTQNNFYEAFLGQDVEQILKSLPENYAYILQKAGSLEEEYSQEEIVQQITKEYKEKFNSNLTLVNYRQLKRRANQKVLQLLKKKTL